MGWYDLFSRFYDRSLEPLYLESRREAVEALGVQQGDVVLDAPCGTGLSFDGLLPALGDDGALIGVDLSAGMLNRARARAERLGGTSVSLFEHDLATLDEDVLYGHSGARHVDRLHVFLGMTAFANMQVSFDALWSLLVPGGTMVIVDVHAPKPGFQGRMVNLVARADIRRCAWEPLEAVAHDFERRDLPSLPQHGGALFLARGRKPH